MSAATEEIVRQSPSYDTIEHLNEDFEIACETQAKMAKSLTGRVGFPPCKGDPAIWVAWSPNCCDRRPGYSLFCDICKRTYQAWAANRAQIKCSWCDAETGGLHSYTPLNKGVT